ncbi:hypothetical protein TNCV_3487371 [Trichonephila clavipes]|nr:hypothetical protein TNCV_3487371 [Trichonephila clavipes]
MSRDRLPIGSQRASDQMNRDRLPTWATYEQEIREGLGGKTSILSPRIKADFGTMEIAKEQLHGGLRASELTRTVCEFTEIKRELLDPCDISYV